MIAHKPGVRLQGIRSEVFHAAHIAEAIWTTWGVPTLVITAGIEGQHTAGSGHYRGCAIDLRTNSFAPEKVKDVVAALQEALGPDYFILYENEGTPNAHCHVEFRPQAAY